MKHLAVADVFLVLPGRLRVVVEPRHVVQPPEVPGDVVPFDLEAGVRDGAGLAAEMPDVEIVEDDAGIPVQDHLDAGIRIVRLDERERDARDVVLHGGLVRRQLDLRAVTLRRFRPWRLERNWLVLDHRQLGAAPDGPADRRADEVLPLVHVARVDDGARRRNVVRNERRRRCGSLFDRRGLSGRLGSLLRGRHGLLRRGRLRLRFRFLDGRFLVRGLLRCRLARHRRRLGLDRGRFRGRGLGFCRCRLGLGIGSPRRRRLDAEQLAKRFVVGFGRSGAGLGSAGVLREHCRRGSQGQRGGREASGAEPPQSARCSPGANCHNRSRRPSSMLRQRSALSGSSPRPRAPTGSASPDRTPRSIEARRWCDRVRRSATGKNPGSPRACQVPPGRERSQSAPFPRVPFPKSRSGPTRRSVAGGAERPVRPGYLRLRTTRFKENRPPGGVGS
jgi:hypothetical protein